MNRFNDKSSNTPTTIGEVGIAIGFIRDKVDAMDDKIEKYLADNITRKEFNDHIDDNESKLLSKDAFAPYKLLIIGSVGAITSFVLGLATYFITTLHHS